jgi:probable phosphoglycerate mutase
MKNIITIQHTQAEHHVKKMVGGNTDWPLTDIGKEQAHKIGKNLLGKLDPDIERILYASDLIRARQVAEIIAEYLKLDINFRPALREINVGSAKGKSSDWFKENRLPQNGKPFIYYKAFSDAESCSELYERLTPFIKELESLEGKNIIIVGHGIALQMFAAQWLKLPIETLENMAFNGSAGGVSFLSENKDKIRVLNSWNDTSYVT